MCRNIKTLFNFEPPASDEEVRGAIREGTQGASSNGTSHGRRPASAARPTCVASGS